MARPKEKVNASTRPQTATRAVSILPEPRHPTLWAAVTYALFTLVLAYPALAGGFLVNPRNDQYIAGYAFREFAASSLRAGNGIPAWNPYLFGGLPYVAAMHGDIFYPTALLRMLVGTDVGMTWGFIIHLFLAGLFTFGFLRAWGFSFFPSLLGGVAYMLSGQIVSFVSAGHDGKLFVSTLLPLALWMLVRGVRDGRPWAWGVFALTIGLAILSPHPQLLQYLLLCGGSFALILAFSDNEGRGKLPRDVALKRLGLALAAVVVGMVMGAIQYLPVLGYVNWSPRAGGAGWEHAISYSMPPEEMINMYLPQFSGILDNYWGRNGIHFHSEYVGAAVFVLAFAGMFAARRRAFKRFWIGALIISLIWSLGGYTPFYHLVYALIPGTKFFRAPSTMLFIVSFSFAVLAALGTERMLAREATPRFVVGSLITAGVIALLATVGAFTNLAYSIAATQSPFPNASDMVAANAGAVIAGGWRSFLFAALAAGLIWAAITDRMPLRAAAWSLVVVVAVDLLSIGRIYWVFMPPAKVSYASDPAIDYLQKAEIGRVLAVPLAGDEAPRDPALLYDGLMSHNIRVLCGYHGNELGRYQMLTSGCNPRQPTPLLRPEIWRQQNVRYLYTTLPDSLVPAATQQFKIPGQLTKLVGPVKNAAGSIVYLYRLPGDNPPAWVAPVGVKAGDEQALGTVLDARFDPLRAAILDSAASFGVGQIQALPPATGVTAKVEKYEPGRIDLMLSAPAPQGSVLVMSENYYPGWQATVGGAQARVTRANFNLIGVELPAGARQVELTFRDLRYATGRLLTLVAFAIAVLGLAAGIVLARRSSMPVMKEAGRA